VTESRDSLVFNRQGSNHAASGPHLAYSIQAWLLLAIRVCFFPPLLPCKAVCCAEHCSLHKLSVGVLMHPAFCEAGHKSTHVVHY